MVLSIEEKKERKKLYDLNYRIKKKKELGLELERRVFLSSQESKEKRVSKKKEPNEKKIKPANEKKIKQDARSFFIKQGLLKKS